MNLTGAYVYLLDKKGRLVVPAAFRAALGAPVRLTAGPNETLLLVPRKAHRRLDLTLTFEQPLDATTGRLLVPHALREWAGLRPGQEVAVCGTGQAVSVLAWSQCLAALRARHAGAPEAEHVPELAALHVENAGLRRRLESERAEYRTELDRVKFAARERAAALKEELRRYRRVVGRLKTACPEERADV